jgi:hypothetical protein
MNPRSFLCAALAAVFTISLSACDGSAGAVPPASVNEAAQTGASAHRHRVMIHFRLGMRRKKRHRGRGTDYISPSMQSFVYLVTGPSPQTRIAAGGAINLSTSSPACTQSGALQSFTCTATVPFELATSGTYAFNVATYDSPQSCGASGVCTTAPCTPGATGGAACSGNALSDQNVPEQLTLAAVNTISLSLGGIAAGTTLTVLPVAGSTHGYLRGDASGLSLWGPSTQYVAAEPVDADGNTIVGAGAPAVSLSTTSAALTVGSVAGSPNTFSIAAVTTSSGAGPVVTPGIVALTVQLTAPAGGGGALPSVNPRKVPVTIAHGIVYVSTLSPAQLLEYFDGNTSTPSVTIAGSNTLLQFPSPPAADAVGNVYVADGGSQDLLQFGPASSGNVAPLSSRALFGTGNFSVSQLAATAGGSIAASGTINSSGAGNGPFITYQGEIVNELSTDIGTSNGVAIDTCGQITVIQGAAIAPNAYRPWSTSCTLGGTTARVCTCFGAPLGLAFDAADDLYVVDFGNASIFEFPPGTSGLGFETPSVTITGANTGMSQPIGLAIDAAGTIYTSNFGGTTITEYASGSIGNATPIATVTVPSGTPHGVTVVPPAFQF